MHFVSLAWPDPRMKREGLVACPYRARAGQPESGCPHKYAIMVAYVS